MMMIIYDKSWQDATSASSYADDTEEGDSTNQKQFAMSKLYIRIFIFVHQNRDHSSIGRVCTGLDLVLDWILDL